MDLRGREGWLLIFFTEHAHVMRERAVVVAQGGDAQHFGIEVAGLSAVPDLSPPPAHLFESGPHIAVEFPVVTPGGQDLRCLADDFRSKRTLSFMQLMFSLAESGGGQTAPVVTVQSGGG